MDRFKIEQLIEVDVFNKISGKTRKIRGLANQLNLQGFYPAIEHYGRNEDGSLFLKDIYQLHNDITNEGKNTILDVMFKDGTQIASTSWYLGLISNSGYSALAAGDTMSSHTGWTEFTGYSQSTRVAWGPGAASGQSTTNATPATFDINATGTLKGIFVTSNSTKSGTTGKLWATGLFAADVPVSNGDQMKITYTVSS
jgi:hypothetical protein